VEVSDVHFEVEYCTLLSFLNKAFTYQSLVETLDFRRQWTWSGLTCLCWTRQT